jgi:hypothetical protein
MTGSEQAQDGMGAQEGFCVSMAGVVAGVREAERKRGRGWWG